MEKVLLINPPHWMLSGIHNAQNAGLGLPTIAAHLRDDYEVEILDAEVMKYGFEILEREIKGACPDIVGITGTSIGAEAIKQTAIITRNIDDNIFLIGGGVHISGFPQEANEIFDLVLVGETDLCVANHIKQKDKGIKLCTPPTKLDNLPMPSYDLIDPPIGSRYYWGNDPIMDRPETVVMWSRGCPHQCIFCSKAAIHRGYPRLRSPPKICDELEYLQDEFGIRTFFVYDDELIGMSKPHNEWMISVCKEIVDRGIEANFKGQGRCSKRFVSDDVLSWMAKAGFKAMMMGCESGSPKVLKRMRKMTTPDDIRFTLPMLKKHGIGVFGFWMIGNVEETNEDAKMTYDLMQEMRDYMDWKQVTILNPLPVSYLWDEGVEKNWFCPDTIWSDLHQKSVVLKMNYMTDEEIENWRQKMIQL